MKVYDIAGREVEDYSLRLSQNDAALVNDFLSVAQSYLGKAGIEYDDGNTVFYKSTATNGIDCSTFVGLCLMGYSYEETPYATGDFISPSAWTENSEHIWALPLIQYTVSRYADGSEPEKAKLACQIARWMVDRNWVVPMTDGFRDVRPGDIVFWGHKVSGTDQWMHPTWYKHINHVGIILSVEDAPSTYVDGAGTTRSWNKSKYPFMHTIIDCGNTTPPCRTSHWLEEGQEDETAIYENNVNTVVLVCRPDFGSMVSGSGGGGTVDDALSDSSENPVQNKVVKAALDGKLGSTGNGSDVTVAFTAAAQRTAIGTGEKLSVLFGKILKWLSDLGSAAFKAATDSIAQNSHDLVESGAVYTALANKYEKPANGIPGTDLAETYLTQHQSLSGYATESWVGQQGFLTAHQDISGKLDADQGAANAGKFLVVGNDGGVVPVTMSAWQGGSY